MDGQAAVDRAGRHGPGMESLTDEDEDEEEQDARRYKASDLEGLVDHELGKDANVTDKNFFKKYLGELDARCPKPRYQESHDGDMKRRQSPGSEDSGGALARASSRRSPGH